MQMMMQDMMGGGPMGMPPGMMMGGPGGMISGGTVRVTRTTDASGKVTIRQ